MNKVVLIFESCNFPDYVNQFFQVDVLAVAKPFFCRIAENDEITYISVLVELMRVVLLIRIKFSLPILIPEMGHHPLSYSIETLSFVSFHPPACR